MTQAMPRAKRVELLLNALEVEKHVRRPLLAGIIDELAEPADQPEAARAARVLLRQLETGIDEREFARAIQRLRAMTQADAF